MVIEEKETVADVSHIGDLDNSSSDAILLATEADTSAYSPWSKAMFRLYGVLAIAYLCGCLNGFDGSLVRSKYSRVGILPDFSREANSGDLPCARRIPREIATSSLLTHMKSLW
jgi:hypothetical protein